MRVSGFVRTTTLEWKGVIASAVTLSEDGDTDEGGDDNVVDGVNEDTAKLVHEHGPHVAGYLFPDTRVDTLVQSDHIRMHPSCHHLRQAPDHEGLYDLADEIGHI